MDHVVVFPRKNLDVANNISRMNFDKAIWTLDLRDGCLRT